MLTLFQNFIFLIDLVHVRTMYSLKNVLYTSIIVQKSRAWVHKAQKIRIKGGKVVNKKLKLIVLLVQHV